MDSSKGDIFLSDNHVDDHVDVEIQQCLSANPPKSFFMFAGAGSGKTRSLIKTLEFLDKEKGKQLAELGKKVAVITYTNAACDEISRRLQHKPIFHVSTIHSFLWELIKNFQVDIKERVRISIEQELVELQFKQSRGRSGEAAVKRAEKIAKKKERLEKLNKINHFTYNPNGDNIGFDSLSHDEVVRIGSGFIETEEVMQQILVSKYPILLIDESQDTKKELVDALLKVYSAHKTHWVVGMFGDTMQRIYTDGKDRLDEVIPKEWVFPEKVMNHRSSKRIVSLANSIRRLSDNKDQRPRADAKNGLARLFIFQNTKDKQAAEKQVASLMATETKDENWQLNDDYQCLILEHHMAATRFSFSNLFIPLDKSGVFDTALRKGEITELAFLANTIAPLIAAHKAHNDFEISRIIRSKSPLLTPKVFECNFESQKEMLEQVESATKSLLALWDNNVIPSCLDVLRNIRNSGLFETNSRVEEILDQDHTSDDPKVIALKEALSVPFDELERYAAYVSEQTKFSTHQGVKGLEFPRVMVILDDSESKGFLFSYEKFFGAKEKTATDLNNEKEGKDTSLRRTARLFYVACTRAMESLAVVVYSNNPEAVRATAISNGWFSADEIVMEDASSDR